MVSLGNPALLPQTCDGTQYKHKRPLTVFFFHLSLLLFPFGGAEPSPPAFCPWSSFSRSLPRPPAQRHTLSPADSCLEA